MPDSFSIRNTNQVISVTCKFHFSISTRDSRVIFNSLSLLDLDIQSFLFRFHSEFLSIEGISALEMLKNQFHNVFLRKKFATGASGWTDFTSGMCHSEQQQQRMH